MKYIFYGFLLGLPMLCVAGKKKIYLANVIDAEVEKEVQEIDFADLEEFYVYNIQGNAGEIRWLKPLNNTFPALRALYLTQCGIGNQGIRYISKMRAKNLEELGLDNNQVDNASLVHLNKSTFDHLRYLQLSRNKITHEGVNILVKGKWSDLECLSLTSNDINYEGALRIANAEFPNLQMVWFVSSGSSVQWDKLYKFFEAKSTSSQSYRIIR